MITKIPIITVDGPSGVGKGAVSFALAQILQWNILDSGSLYRTLALAVLRQKIDINDEDALSRCAQSLDISFNYNEDNNGISVLFNTEDISNLIRKELYGSLASKVAAFKGVRKALLLRQREFQKPPGLIADGRDMGTVVFQDATVKIYLSASREERARRRYKQLKEKGFSVNLARLSDEIAERDDRDKVRKESPMKPASDAVIIDTTEVNVKQVVRQITDLAKTAIPELQHKL